MPVNVAADDFAHRKQKFALIHEHLDDPDAEGPSYKTGPRREENEERLLTLVISGALPWSGPYHPEGYSETWGIHSDYFLQNFFSVGEEIVAEDCDAEAVLRKKAQHERILAEGRGKPSATDGSKGQWRTYHRNVITACQWFLGEWSGTEWMTDASLSRAPEGWADQAEGRATA